MCVHVCVGACVCVSALQDALSAVQQLVQSGLGLREEEPEDEEVSERVTE